MLTIGPGKIPYYSNAGVPVRFRLANNATAPFFRLHVQEPVVTAEAESALILKEGTDAFNTRKQLLRARPVYLTPSVSGNGMCFVVGPAGAGNIPIDDPTVRAWLASGNRYSMVGKPGRFNNAANQQAAWMTDPDLRWSSGGVWVEHATTKRVWSDSQAPRALPSEVRNWLTSAPRAVGVDAWRVTRLSALSSGVVTCFFAKYANGSNGPVLRHGRTYASADPADYEEKFIGVTGAQYTADKLSGNEWTPQSHQRGLVELHDSDFASLHRFTVRSGTSCPILEESRDGGGWAVPFNWSFKLHATPPVGSLAEAYHLQAQAMITTARAVTGLEFPSTGYDVGSAAPFAFLTRQVGWATGLAHEVPFYIMDLTETTLGDQGVIVTDAWVAQDLPSGSIAKLFPAWNAPEAARPSVIAAYSDLDPNVWFRVASSLRGFTYGNIRFDGTTLALDASRAESSLDDILFDDLEDDKPAISYESLGARSLLTISDKRNRSVCIPLISEASPLASRADITFTISGEVVSATQNGAEIDAGEAQIAIRVGAKAIFSGVTPSVVATTFFGMPTWDAVAIPEGAQAEGHMYSLDEAALTVDGRFITTDDARARALPILLGWGQDKFASAVASTAFGVYNPEILQ